MRFVENSLCEYASLLREQGLSEEKIFGKLLEEFNGTPYVLGGVTVDGCDCSGTVCAALNALYSKDLRTTAHGLYTQVFTEPFVDENRIHAVFCMAVDKHGDVRAVHVAGLYGRQPVYE